MNSNFEDYWKIVDVVMPLCTSAFLKMNVSLQYLDANNMSHSYHQEFNTYDADGRFRSSIRRTYDYYLSIETFGKQMDREFIRIGLSELYRLRMIMPHILEWFTSPEFVGLFAYNQNHELYIDKQVDSIMVDNLPMGKFISFEPVVINFNSKSVEGVRMYLNSDNTYIDIPYEMKFIGFADIILHFDLYLAAQNMLNYFGRPEFGTNSITIGNKFV